MNRLPLSRTASIAALLTALASMPAAAQQPPASTSATPAPASQTPAPASQTPAPASQTSAPAGDAASADPHLSVASVRMNGGMRASKIIGTAVTNDHNESVGTIDDLMLTDQAQVALAVISVGGFLGIGSKLVAVPYPQLQHAPGGKLVWPDATKQSVNDMPNFTYGG